jgi:hypothetical protein
VTLSFADQTSSVPKVFFFGFFKLWPLFWPQSGDPNSARHFEVEPSRFWDQVPLPMPRAAHIKIRDPLWSQRWHRRSRQQVHLGRPVWTSQWSVLSP